MEPRRSHATLTCNPRTVIAALRNVTKDRLNILEVNRGRLTLPLSTFSLVTI
jgi:hypothetical protein